MDTLDKILKTHPIPIHLRLKKEEFELVIVSQYPHGYDVSHRHIFSGVDEAFIKALEHSLGLEGKPYAWRIYGYGQVKIAQSPNLLEWLPDGGFTKLEKLLDEYRQLEVKNNDQYADALLKIQQLEGKLTAMELDRDDWRDSCKLANKRIDITAQAEKENHRLRKMLQSIVDYGTPMELRRLISEAAKMLKELVKHG
jgi:hypothetical protein